MGAAQEYFHYEQSCKPKHQNNNEEGPKCHNPLKVISLDRGIRCKVITKGSAVTPSRSLVQFQYCRELLLLLWINEGSAAIVVAVDIAAIAIAVIGMIIQDHRYAVKELLGSTTQGYNFSRFLILMFMLLGQNSNLKTASQWQD